MVPKGWERKVLSKVAEIRTGVAKGKKGLKDPIEVPYLRVANVQDGHIDLTEVKSINIERHQLERYCLKQGDVLMTEGGDFDKLGRGDVWQGQIEPCINQNHVFAVRTNQEVLLPYFLASLSASHYGKTYFLSCAKRSTNLASINSTQLKEFPVLIPPLPEQQKIAKILSTWDKAISTTERLVENSNQQKKALTQQLLTGKKRLLDDNGERFLGEWKEAKLSKWLVEYKEKSTIQDQHDVYTSSRNGLVLQSDYFANSRIAGRDNIGFHVIPPNHITYRSRSDDGFFTFNLFSNDAKGLISNYYPVFNTKGSNIFFIALFEQYRAVFGRYSVGTSQKVLSINALKDILFKIPSIEEQQKIATVLTNADKEIELLEQQLAHLQQEKKALMQQLLTGKKRVVVEA